MADLKLSLAMAPYDRILPLISGEVKPDGITLEYAGLPGAFSRVFYEQMKFQRYDVSEMSISNFLRMRPGGWPYLMLPVFHNRNFSYTNIRIRQGSGIRQEHPEDLKGKRFGVSDYLQSAAMWTRGILQTEFGVAPEDMVWYQESGEHLSYAGASAEGVPTVPASVKLHHAKMSLSAMYLKGELDASVSPSPVVSGPPAPRRGGNRSEAAEIVPLFPDPRKEAIRFFQKVGVYPPHHTTVVRESIVKEHPWVAVSLLEAFEESKKIAIARLRQMPPSLLVFGPYYLSDLDQVFGPDPFVYGIKANAKAFEMAQTFSFQQGLTQRQQPHGEIFPQELIYREERLAGAHH